MTRNRWERFLDSLDTSGGHIAVLFVLIGVGVGIHYVGLMNTDHVIDEAVGALLMALKQVRSVLSRNQTADAATLDVSVSPPAAEGATQK